MRAANPTTVGWVWISLSTAYWLLAAPLAAALAGLFLVAFTGWDPLLSGLVIGALSIAWWIVATVLIWIGSWGRVVIIVMSIHAATTIALALFWLTVLAQFD
ncbi:MAG: hypothetical protein JWM25_1132 [Thermoleophilia bacterium]|nr:hypothetical protein [Thermoleophilia bacterium]